jgi:hypothetical protein
MFAAVDAIDAHIAARKLPYPNRGHIICPNCAGTLLFANLTDIKGAARCDTPNCVDFTSLIPP